MRQLLWIGLGAALGGCLRLGADLLWQAMAVSTFPVATFLVNISGSLLIGYLAGHWMQDGREHRVHPWRFHFWVTGFCGGFTTFSSFAWQLQRMLASGEGQAAGLYAAASVGFGLIAVWLGLSLAIRRLQTESSVQENP